MLNSPEQEVLVKACEAIYRFAEKGDENSSSLVGLGAVEPLTHLISHQDKAVRRNAFMCLGVMASNNDVKRLLKKLNVITSIINKLSPEEDVVVHEYATLCLVSLSVDFTGKVQIYERGGLEPLLRLLSSPDPDVQKNSVECICNLVKDSSSRVAVRELNGLPLLLELLRSDFPVIQQLALRSLESMSTDGETRTRFREERGFRTLLEFLTTKEFSDLHSEALAVVSNCLEDVESVRLIQATGGLETLLQFVMTASLPDVQANAVRAICRLAQSGEVRKILHEQDVEKALVSLLAVEDDGVRTATCQAVAAMSQLVASRDTFRHLDGVRTIVQLLSCEGGDVRESAVHALSGLTDGNQLNAYAVCEAGGDERVTQLLQEGRPAVVPHAAAVLTNMASHEPLRTGLLAHGAVRALAELLRSTNHHVLSSVTRGVAELACDAEGRAELRNVGGLAPLVTLLRSDHAETRRKACWAVSVCANDEVTATEMCKLGALEALQEINYSANRMNKFSELALQKLLDSNLSVKYSLTGCLSYTDITTEVFYDPGQVKEGHRVPALEDIAKQAVNQHRAVIVVNGKPPYQTDAQSEDRQQDSPTETRTSSVTSSKGSSRTQSKLKGRGRREDEKQRDEEECPTPLEAPVEKPWTVPYDPSFLSLVREAVSSVLPLTDQAEMYAALAKLVCVAMGGPTDIAKQHDFQWELHTSELKVEVQSNIIPIGKIKKGTYYHRALLFKALADRIGVACTLVRGSYNRAWNEVLLTSTPTNKPTFYPQPKSYVVDLMHSPGSLLRCGTPAALEYQMI
ncbi:armadillo repeat-containing protein 3 isoform X2 [Brachyhypopomus gauderio]